MPAKTSKPKTAQIPKLRFPGFSGAWEEKRLGEICEIITGNTPPTSQRDFYEGNYCFVSPVDIQERRYINTTKTSLSEKGFLKSRKISKDAVLFVCIGSTIGKVAQAGVDCATNQQINSLIANFENSNDFIYSLLSLKAKKIKLLAGEQAVPIINKNDFSKIRLYFPFLPEQQKIAEFLGATDEWIENLRAQKESLESYKKGMMQKIFPAQGGRVPEIRFHDDNGKDFPEWEEKRLGDIMNIIAGQSKSEYLNNEGDNIIVDMGGISSDGKLIASKYTNYNDDFLTINDLVMPKDDIGGGFIIGRVAMIPEDNKYICGDHIFKLTLKFGVVGYLFYAINSFEINKSFRRKSNGTAQLGLNKKEVEKQIISFPSLLEQQKIADFLTSIDNLIEFKGQQITQAEQWKSGLMQGLFV